MRALKIALPKFFFLLIYLCFIQLSFAGIPVWTFTPDPNYPPNITITDLGSATVKYTITNQSRRPHTLSMQPIQGVTQYFSYGSCSDPFRLEYQQSCTLTLFVNGALLTGSVLQGPIVCEQGSTLECYQPSKANRLTINLVPFTYYTLTPSAGPDGSISPNTPQTVVSGTSFTFTATPILGYQVDEWLVDDGTAQRGGSTFTLSTIESNHSVQVTFTRAGTLFAGTASGKVYLSTDNGNHWNATTSPSGSNAVKGLFATVATLYAASADGKIYYSTNNGSTWTATSAPSGSSAVNGVYATASTLYASSADGKVYYSTNNGSTWTATSAPSGSNAVNGIYATATKLYAASADGNVYSSTNNGNTWSQIAGPQSIVNPINYQVQNIFDVNGNIYINTREISTNSTLPAGTVNFEYAYVLTNPFLPWSLLSQITYTLFVNSDASLIYAGTQNGHVFSLITGDDLGFVTNSPITSLFFFG